ncbi:MAG: ABC transporter ATP-binding protein [Deltaproteobacteria bacterium]|nr:ABC transporter ATP-binding protein [Deltaproteobacteria bacterium]
MALLEVEQLRTYLSMQGRVVKAVDDVSFTVDAGETLALVGESGCGKSMTALSLLRLIPEPPAKIIGGSVWLTVAGARTDLLKLSGTELRAVRGRDLAMIFQEPMTALNPVMRAGSQIAEAIQTHERTSGDAVQARVMELLQLVGIPEPRLRAAAYPHELSGGMRQRVMIAMALAGRPKLLIADEPTTALDVTVQAQILSLLQSLQQRFGMGLVLITHDLGIVAQVSDRVAVMYAGKIVESAGVRELFARPRHPYTVGLLHAVPQLSEGHNVERLTTIPGRVPDLAQLPIGCAFQDRCPRVQSQCREVAPPLEMCGDRHAVRCFNPVVGEKQ